MLKKTLLILLIIFTSNLSAEFNGKYEIIPLPFKVGLEKMKIVESFNENQLVAAGKADQNVYYHISEDGGHNWTVTKVDTFKKNGNDEIVNLPLRPHCTEVTPNNTVYVGLDSGSIDRSTDFGKTWERIELGYRHSIRELIMQDNNKGIALISGLDPDTSGGANWPEYSYIVFTNDGWETWRKIEKPKYSERENGEGWKRGLVYQNDICGFSAPHYNEDNPGVALYLSTDYGETWFSNIKDNLMEQFEINNNNELWGTSGIKVSDESKFYNTIIKKSTDFGQTWDTVFVDPDTANKFVINLIKNTKIHFLDNGRGYMFFSSNQIWKTDNNGLSWIKYEINWDDYPNLSHNLNDYTFLNRNKIFFSTITNFIIYNDNITSVASERANISLKVYPNPSTDFVYFNFSNLGHNVDRLEVYDINGKVIKEINSNSLNNIMKLDLTNTKTGNYFYKIYSNDEVVAFGKFVVGS